MSVLTKFKSTLIFICLDFPYQYVRNQDWISSYTQINQGFNLLSTKNLHFKMRNIGEIIFCHDGYCGATLIQNSHKKLVKRSKHFKCFFIKQQSSRHQIMGSNKKKRIVGSYLEIKQKILMNLCKFFFHINAKISYIYLKTKCNHVIIIILKKQKKTLKLFKERKSYFSNTFFFRKQCPLRFVQVSLIRMIYGNHF